MSELGVLKTYAPILVLILPFTFNAAAQATNSGLTTAIPLVELKDGNMAGSLLKSRIAEEDKQWRNGKAEGISADFYSCIKRNNYVALQVSTCASDEKGLQNARLNRIYKELLEILNDKQKNALVEAQRSWLAWKHKEEMLEEIVYSSEQMDNAELEVREMNRLARRADELDHYKADAGLRTD